MNGKKYYVVWFEGKGSVFDSWESCRRQLAANKGSVCKSFRTEHEAYKASLDAKRRPNNNSKKKKVKKKPRRKINYGEPILNSISVDGASSNVTGLCEYKGVNTHNGEEIFKMGVFDEGTNNLVEFLAIVHALMYCEDKGLTLPIYSDSTTAMAWVRNKAIKTTQPRTTGNVELFTLIDKALEWLDKNEYPNKILKWQTKAWGENPADFGRK